MAETRITDEEMRQFGVGIPDPTGPGLKNVTNDYELDPMSLPVGANPETDWYVGRNELGEKTYRMGDGREYTVRRVVPEDRFTTEAGTWDRAREVAGQRVGEAVQGVTQAVTAPARAARGEGVTLGDALNTAGMAGTGTVGATTTARVVSGKSLYDPTEVSSFGAGSNSNRVVVPKYNTFGMDVDPNLPDAMFGTKTLSDLFGDKPFQEVAGRPDYENLVYAPNISVHSLAELESGLKSVETLFDEYGVDPEPYLVDYVYGRMDALRENPEYVNYVRDVGNVPSSWHPADQLWSDSTPVPDTTVFRSPIPELISSVQIPERGILGSQWLKELQDNPSVRNSEVRSMGVTIEPGKRYTREELSDLYRDNIWEVEGVVDEPRFAAYQRQLVTDPEVDYLELNIRGNRPNSTTFSHENDPHFTDDNISHARASIRSGQNGNYLLVEELQSDLLQGGYKSDINSQIFPVLHRLNWDLFDKANLDWKRYLQEDYSRDLADLIADRDPRVLGDRDTLIAVMERVDKLPTKNVEEFYDEVRRISSTPGSNEPLPSILDYVPSPAEPPIRKTEEGVRLALDGLIPEAARRGVTRIVIPNLEQIVSRRFRPGSEDYSKAMGQNSGFRNTYVKSVNKVLDEYRDEFGDLISISDVNLGYENDLPTNAIELDISKLLESNYDIYRPKLAEGGLVMEDQMTRLMAQGGLNSDGMRVDPVSGNEVPAGSMASEVRDDIDAKLSEGEYVVPADVVRYYGVKFFEDLRSEAKGGLSEMEADGRIGGEPAPMEGAPRISEEEMAMLQAAASKQMGMAAGGVVSASPLSEDQLIENLISVVKNDPSLMNKLGQRGVMLFEGGLVDGYAEGGIVEPTFNPNQWLTVGGSYFGGNQQVPAATPIENRTYRGPNGETITIRFQNGVALDPIPVGYVPEAEYTTTDLQQTGSDRGDRTPFQAPQTPAVEREPEDPAVYRGVNFNDPVAAAKAALEGTQGTLMNRLLVGGAGMVNPALGLAMKEHLVGNGLATARANLMVAQQYGTPEQVAEIEKALAEAEKNAPNTLSGGVLNGIVYTGQNIFDDAVSQYEKYGVLTPQGAIDAVTSGAGIGRARAMTAAEVQAGQDYAKKGDDRDTSWAGGKVATTQTKPTYTSDKEREDAVEKAVAATGVRATGGRARGGLMGKANRT